MKSSSVCCILVWVINQWGVGVCRFQYFDTYTVYIYFERENKTKGLYTARRYTERKEGSASLSAIHRRTNFIFSSTSSGRWRRVGCERDLIAKQTRTWYVFPSTHTQKKTRI
jgi:hypothetical protein